MGYSWFKERKKEEAAIPLHFIQSNPLVDTSVNKEVKATDKTDKIFFFYICPTTSSTRRATLHYDMTEFNHFKRLTSHFLLQGMRAPLVEEQYHYSQLINFKPAKLSASTVC